MVAEGLDMELLKGKGSSAKLPTIPKIEDLPEWAAAESKLTDLKTARNEVETRKRMLLGELNEAGTSPRSQDLQQRAQDLIDSDNVREMMQQHRRSISSISEDLHHIGQEFLVLDRAINLHEHQMAELRSKLSRELCAKLEPEFRKIAERTVAAVRAGARANEEQHQLFRAIADAGFSSGMLRSAIFTGIGREGDEYSRANIFLADWEKQGTSNIAKVRAA
jgi:hypothetical protein